MLAEIFAERDRWWLAGVLLVSCIAAAFEVIGVASILPFMALVINPEAIQRYPFIASVAGLVGARTPREILLALGVATALLVTLGNAAAAANVVIQQKFSARTLAKLSAELFAGFMAQPYAFHVSRDSAGLLKVLLVDAFYVVTGVVTPLITGFSRLVMVAGILGLLLLQDPHVALIVAGVLGFSYSLVFAAMKGRQRHLSAASNSANQRLYSVAQEGLGGVKDLMILGRENDVVTRFAAASNEMTAAQAANAITAPLPRYILEPVAFGGILAVTLGLIAKGGDSAQQAVPLLALYAFAGYRMLPALQQAFEAAMSVRFNTIYVRSTVADIRLLRAAPVLHAEPPVPGVVPFQGEVRLDGVGFQYAGAAKPSLTNVSLTIGHRECIGLIGRTGAGKTTLVDLLLGLYEPTEGTISVDGVPLRGSAVMRAWRRRIGYVPQHIYLANASIAQNIAFGVPTALIDHEAVHEAAKLAQAADFISALPERFDTIVGERGVRLSGGQRQRLGIARALYHRPDFLVFDEATSALDGLTEDAVMDAVRSLSGDRTIVLVAHRLRTVEVCDRIVLMESGRIVHAATHNELLRESEEFRRMLGVAEASDSST